MALLSSKDGLKAWARPMAPDKPGEGKDSDLVPVDPNDWERIYLDRQIREGFRPQVFLQRKMDNISVKHDLYLSQHQFNSYWPKPKPLDADDHSIWWAFAVPAAFLTVLGIAAAYPQWKRTVFPPMERSLGVGKAIILPYPRDNRLLEIQVEIKNTSNQYIQFQTSGFLIRVGDDIRRNAKGLGPATIIPSQVQTLFSGPFDLGENKTNATLAGADVYIEYGPVDGKTERALVFSIACDFLLGKTIATTCRNLRNQDIESR